MRKPGLIRSLLLLSLVTSACSSLAATREPPASASASPTAPAATRNPTPTLAPTPTATPSDLWIDPSGVQVHPDGGLYSGDALSFRIEARNGSDQDLSRVPVVVDWGFGQITGTIDHLLGGESGRVDLVWAWDTTGIAGAQSITVTVDPHNATGDPNPTNNVAAIPINLATERPAGEVDAKWQTATSTCCTFHFISGTAAARDIGAIRQTADEAFAHVEERLGVRRKDRVDVYLLSRVLGHGGFAGETIAISYLDRNYAPGGLLEVLRHEGAHVLDRQIVDGERPVFLVEGFATYVTGGHFKIEPLPQRAAALLRLGGYIPLRALADDFYPSQHEIGYLEASAFIDYLVQRDGFDRFLELYDGMQRRRGESDADLIDREMRAAYGIGLDGMEAEWLAHLRTLDAGLQLRDLSATIAFYDTLRRYQRALDPSAHFRGVWLPDIRQAESRGLVADVLRHPRAPENIALETMLIAAGEALDARDFDRAGSLLASINAVLDAGATFVDPVAARYLDVVRAALASGYEPQRIMLDGDRAGVRATRGDSTLVSLSLALQNGAWLVQ
jgi:hypothetical protein